MSAIVSGFANKVKVLTATASGKTFLSFSVNSATEGKSGGQSDRKTFWLNVSFFPGIIMEQMYDENNKKILMNGWQKREDLSSPEEMAAALEGSLIELRDVHIDMTPYLKKDFNGQITAENVKQAVGMNASTMCGMVVILRPASHFNRDGSKQEKQNNQSANHSNPAPSGMDDMDDDIPF